MIVRHYDLCANSNVPDLVIAVCSDLHDKDDAGRRALAKLYEIKPQLILLPGDIVENHQPPFGYGLSFLTECAKLAPSFMSLGNHETGGRHQFRKGQNTLLASDTEYRNFLTDIRNTGVSLLDNSLILWNQIWIAGLTSPLYRNEEEQLCYRPIDNGLLHSLSQKEGYKILLNHHPELFVGQTDAYPIDLSLSGHAHGGQIRFLGRGLYAPGQGVFPELTRGMFRSSSQECHHLIVSAGLSNNTFIPRIGNPTELVVIHLHS